MERSDAILTPVLPEESEEELYQHAPCGYLSALPDGTLVRVNQTLLDWTGYTRESLLGKRLPDLLPVVGKIFYETHYDPLLRMQGFIREMALDLVCAGGRSLPVLLNSVLHRDSAGRPLVVRTTVFDATERRAYERELLLARRQAEQLATIVEHSADAILIISPDGTVLTWNDGAERLFGYSAAEAVGESLVHLIVPDDYVQQFEELVQLTQSGQRAQLETVRRHKDGTRLDVSLGLTPLSDESGEPSGSAAIIRDVSERKRLEARLRQTEQLQSVAALAGGVAHEVNNQMAVVLGFGDFVLKALGTGHPQSRDVDAMIGAAAKAAQLSRQLLAFSRQLPMVHREVDLAELLAELAPRLAEMLGPEQSLVVRSPGVPGLNVRADPRQLEQVLIELTRNAGDAMRAGGRLTIALDRAELTPDHAAEHAADDVVAGSYVLLEVSDTGCGMDSVTLRRAFEPFFTTKPFGKGTGLGLAMTHGIVKQHGGQVWAASEVGKGTTIRVYLPRVEAPTELAATE